MKRNNANEEKERESRGAEEWRRKGKQEEDKASKREKEKKEWIVLTITAIVKTTESLRER